MRIVYVVSLFPCWSETFIVREIHELVRLGADVRIVSLRHASEKLVQSDAEALLGRVTYPGSPAKVAFAGLAAFLGAPLAELVQLARFLPLLARHPAEFAKTLVAWWRTLSLLGAVRDLAPRHVHAHFATYPSTAAMVLARRLDVPYSFTCHAHDIFLEDHFIADKARTAAFLVAISRFNREFLHERVPATREADIRIVHCGVSPSEFAFTREGREARVMLAVGRLDDIKGFPVLVEACAELVRRGIDFQCDIVGSGPLEAMLRARIAELGLEGRVNLLGVRRQEEVRTLLARAGLFVLPSVVTARGDRDGIPVALMEAMACGAPVVSTRVSGIPELVEDGVTGLLADPRDAKGLADGLARLLEEPTLGEKLVSRARERVEREFDIRTEAAKLHAAFAGG